MPTGNMSCSPLCPFRAFTCYRDALIYRRSKSGGGAFCTWIGDTCIGWKCQYAMCTRHALMPDGTCRLRLEASKPKEASEEGFSIEEEARMLDKQVYSKIRDKLKKLGRVGELE